MIWLILLCTVLAITIIILSVKIISMHRAMTDICAEFSEKLQSDTNTLISVSTTDKTVRRLANEINASLRELRRQRRRFVQGDAELKNAVTNISHDLRTPLTAICGYLELLDHAEKSETAERYVHIIRERTEVLSQLTEELFRYSVITSARQGDPVEPVLVNGVLEESILGFYAALRERNITPNICMTEKKVIRTLNKAALSRIFSNLLSNAIKYSNGDLDIMLTDTGQITFSNMASELSEVQVERLFDRFYTVESARKSTGLGLSIARTLVEQMNGTISAGYESGRLTVFVQLPDATDV